MSAIKLDKFGGMIPAWSERLLPDGQAAYSRDCYLFSGELQGWRQPKLLRALKDSTAKFACRIPIDDDTLITASNSFFFESTDPDTTFVRTPIVDDTFVRHYW